MRLFRRHLEPAELGLSLVDAPGGPAAAHLESCPHCRRQRDRVAARLEAARAAAQAAADAAFSPSDLERQRQTILQRIGRLGAAPRVLPFPGVGPVATHPTPPAADRRWVLAAAAAGLILGIGLGRLPGTGVAVRSERAAEPVPLVAAAEPSADPWRDEMLLSDVEEVLSREIRLEFEALDGLTPVAYGVR